MMMMTTRPPDPPLRLLPLLLLLYWTLAFSPTTTTTAAAAAAARTTPTLYTTTPWPGQHRDPDSAPTDPSPLMIPSEMASDTPQQTTAASSRADARDFNCPRRFCECYLYRPGVKIWLNCTVDRLQKTAELQDFFRSIPVTGSTFLTITCTTPTKSYLYDGMVSHLSGLLQLDFVNCLFTDIPKDVFQGLTSLDSLTIKRASLVGHVDPEFTRHAPRLRLLEILFSHVTYLPPFCGLRNLRNLNVSYNRLADLEHAGLKCPEDPLLGLEILDLNYNNISAFPAWLGDSMPNLIRISSGDNAIGEMDGGLCEKLSNLMYLDLAGNRLSDASRVNIRKCSRLRILALGANPMRSLPAGAFDLMESLQNLHLFSMGLNDNVWDMISNLTYLNVLELQNNSLVTVSPVVMRDLSNLLLLNLSHNAIRDLPKKAFVTQYRLKSLDLSSNGMLYLSRQAFSSLISLEDLDLSNNNVSDIDDSTFIGLRSLKRLSLRDNFIRSVPIQSFAALSSLQVLDFSKNMLISISDDAFQRMDALVHVNLSHNRLLSVPFMSGLFGLSEVDLSHNNLTSISSMFTGLQNLTTVSLRDNRLTLVSSKTFHDCNNLRYLDLAHNDIPALNSFHLPRLEYLDLSHNAISSIGSMFRFVKLRTLLMSGNNLKKIYRGEVPASVEFLDLSFNQISHISPFTFTSLGAVRQVNLTFNELTSLSANAMEISFSQVVYSQPMFFLKGNPLRCDCELGWLKDWSLGELPSSVIPLPNFSDLDQLQCRSGLVEQNQTDTLTLTARERSEFLCSYSRKCGQGCVCCGFETCFCLSVCPRECSCYMGDSRFVLNRVDCAGADLSVLPSGIPDAATEILLDGNSLETLLALSFIAHAQAQILRLNNSDIHFIENNTFRGLQRLKTLYLQDNFLSVVYNQTFKDLQDLEFLFLQNNDISFVEEGAFAHMRNLRVLNLEKNSLMTLPFSDFSGAPSLTSLRLRDNFWSCGPNFTCSFFQFLSNSSAVNDVKKLLCYDYEETFVSDARHTNGTPILSVPLGDCGENLTDYFNITREVSQSLHAGQRLSALIIISALSFLAVIFLVVVYLNRHLLQVWCFTKFGWRVFKMVPGGEDKDRPYDAFVSYSNLDEQFVVQELAPRLENGYKHFRLCLHYRDFPVGASIAETIVKSVESSKRTIILVSSNFLESEWCKFEFQTAHQQVLTERKNRVIMILLHKVDETKLDQTLKLYMRTRTYLKYDDPWFWEKLMFAMPDKKAEKFERLPSTRDLEYMAQVGRTPTKTASTSGSPSNGHVSVVTDMVRNDMYEVPVSSVASYERVNESMSMSSSLYNGSISAGSGHYEEVTPRAISLQPMSGNSSQNCTPPPLPPLPKRGLLPHDAVKNSSKEMLTRDENWV